MHAMHIHRSGGEDDEGLHGEARQKVEAGHAGHLNVEEEDVNGWAEMVVELFESFADQLRCRKFQGFMIGEQALEALDGERFVIDEIGAEWACFHRHLSYAGRTGERQSCCFASGFELAGRP